MSALAVLLPLSSLAQPSLYEVEPNNIPAEATEISGEVIVIGTLINRVATALQFGKVEHLTLKANQGTARPRKLPTSYD